MKGHFIGHLALATRYVTAMDILELRGFDMTKKVFEVPREDGTVYYQAENHQEDRELRLTQSTSFHLARQKEAAGGGYR